MKNFKIALLALLIVGSIGALFAFTSPAKAEKKLATVTYYFDPSKDYTNDAVLTNSANWSTTPFSACGTNFFVKVCSISFDSGTSPGSGYISGGSLNFTNTTLATAVKTYRTYAAAGSQNPFTDATSQITFNYRPL